MVRNMKYLLSLSWNLKNDKQKGQKWKVIHLGSLISCLDMTLYDILDCLTSFVYVVLFSYIVNPVLGQILTHQWNNHAIGNKHVHIFLVTKTFFFSLELSKLLWYQGNSVIFSSLSRISQQTKFLICWTNARLMA